MNIELDVYYLCESESDVIFMYEKAKELKTIRLLEFEIYSHANNNDYYLYLDKKYDGTILLNGINFKANKYFKIVDVKLLRRKYKLGSL